MITCNHNNWSDWEELGQQRGYRIFIRYCQTPGCPAHETKEEPIEEK